MSICLLGNKIGMTQIFDDSNSFVSATLIKIGPCVVTQIKTELNDGYNAIQIGYMNVLEKNVNRAQLGHFKKYNLDVLKHLKEFRVNNINDFSVGQILTADLLSKDQFVNISGKTIGKGFSGFQKRHNFAKGPMSHGSKHHRAPGSIGMGTTPGRVFSGKKMAGQLGNKIKSIKNLKILNINSSKNIIIVKGSTQGKPGNLLTIMSAYK